MLRFDRSFLLLPLFLAAACGGGGGQPVTRLSLLEFSGATLQPAFSPNTLVYTATVPTAVDAVTLSASVDSPTTNVSVNGTDLGTGTVALVVPLVVGANAIAITLADAGGALDRTYDVTMVRAAPAELADLSVVGAELVPAFDAGTTTYSATVGFLMEQAAVMPVAGDGIAIEVDGTPGTSGASSPRLLVVGNNQILVRATNAAGELRDYTIQLHRQPITTFAEEAYVKATNATAGDRFGNAVAFDGDTLVVGAPFEDSNASGIDGIGTGVLPIAGAAYVFVQSGGTWTQQAYIKAFPSRSDEFFGHSCALQGDTLAVGAYRGGNLRGGSVYLFSRTGSTWTAAGILEPIAGDSEDHFGESLSLSGDTLVVGAPDEDSSTSGVGSVPDENAPRSGAVYVFTRIGGTFVQTAYVKASNPGAGDRFGSSVACVDDTLIVGAPFEDGAASGIAAAPDDDGNDNGAVYVFRRAGGTWSQELYVKSGISGLGRRFGWSVAISGATFAVGESGGTGDVQLFTLAGATWQPEQRLSGLLGFSAEFGISVALAGDMLAVGDLRFGGGSLPTGPDTGSAYVYRRSGGIWTQVTQVLPLHPTVRGFFGSAVALSGDRLAIGEMFEGTATTGINNPPVGIAVESGAVHVMR